MTKKAGDIAKKITGKTIRRTSKIFMPSIKLYKDVFKQVSDDLCQQKGIDEFIMSPVASTVLNYFYEVEDFDKKGVVINTADLNKGLLIYGPYGVGKSFLMEVIHGMMKVFAIKYNKQYMWFSYRTAPWFVEEYMRAAKADGSLSNFALEIYYRGRLYIDDLGLEELAFGKKDIMADLLFHRHRNEAPTYITTNLKPSEIADRYGGHIGDRLPEMFNIIKWDGESLRKE